MQRRFESDPLLPGDAAAAAGARAAGRARSTRTRAERVDVRAASAEPRDADARLHRPRHAGARGAAAVERPLPRDGHQRGRRLQPLEGPRRHALARGRDAATTGARSATCATSTSGEFWSTAYQPTLKRAATATRRSSPKARAEFRRRDDDIETHTEIVVSPEDDIELRRVTHHQPRRATARTIEVTSYAEVVLAPAAADALHPAFSNLFVQTEIVRAARRRSSARAGRARPRSARRGCST